MREEGNYGTLTVIKEIILACALAVPAATWKPPLTHADAIVHAFLAMMTQAKTMDDVFFINRYSAWNETRERLMDLGAGGFALIEGHLYDLKPWFKSHGWMEFPMMWRTYHIFKKPLYNRLTLVQNA